MVGVVVIVVVVSEEKRRGGGVQGFYRQLNSFGTKSARFQAT